MSRSGAGMCHPMKTNKETILIQTGQPTTGGTIFQSPLSQTKNEAADVAAEDHDRTENACTVSTSRCPIQSLRKLF